MLKFSEDKLQKLSKSESPEEFHHLIFLGIAAIAVGTYVLKSKD